MDRSAPAMFQTLEASGLGAMIRDAVWVYPVANVGHVVSVVVLAGAVAVMDARLLGAFPAAAPGDVVRGARRIAVTAFLGVLLTGGVLFTAEATHLVLNPVFQTKMLLVALGLLNIIVFELAFGRTLSQLQPHVPLPIGVRASAFLSIAIWLAVVVAGRSIAYV